ncbi:MAG: mechanosensitive ion channel domain-containing protein [Burkholderiales bacterium]
MGHLAGHGKVRSSGRSRSLFGLAAFILLVAIPGAASLAQQADLLPLIAAENAEISNRIKSTGLALARARGELARLHKSREDLDASMQQIDKFAQLPGLGREFVQTVIEQLRTLPRPEALTARVAESRLVVAASDAHLRDERALRALSDVDAALAQRLTASGGDASTSATQNVETGVRGLLAEQRDLLTGLVAEQQQLLQTLREIDSAEQKLEQRSVEARAKLTQLLFWIPVRPGSETFSELGQSLAWTVSPGNWRAALAIAWRRMAGKPLWPAVALVVAGGLYAARKRLQHRLAALAPAAMPGGRYRIGHALAALAITLALALPLPLVMHTAGTLLQSAPDAEGFARALGDIVQRTAMLVLALVGTAWLLDRRGVGVLHFGWDETSLTFAAGALRRFTALFVPLVLVAGLNGLDHAPFANRESLGRVTTVVAMIVLAAFLVHLLRRRSPLMQRLVARAPRSWSVRLHPLWFTVVVALPLGTAALSAAGYFVAAGHFFGRMVYSLFLILGSLMLYGLMALWVQVQRAGLARHDENQATRRAQAQTSGASSGASLPVQRPIADIAAIGEQTRSLFDLLITLLLLGGMWWIWKDSVPALSDVGNYALWTYKDTVDGKEIARPLTVGHLFLAMLVGAVTVVAVRNVGALLDIVLLQRLEVQADATYAIKVTARYALAAAGIMLAANIFGIAWSDVQWLVAALGVGLGFGLQEIFGNFVAGLIVLVERPVRVGDVVTIGDVSGTVERIRARVITVVDFDNKEVLIPNKSLITDRVINWTLSSQTTRLVLKFRVAGESDLALVQRVMLETVELNPDVLRDPAPRVFFAGSADGALTFEINAFVDSFAKRQRVQHEINLAIDQALREHGVKIP